MQNTHLLGVRQVDRVDLRLSLFVVAGFAVVTIISYINELNRAGLLDGNKHRPQLPYRDTFSGRHRVERSVDGFTAPHDDALIQKNGQVHQLGLEIHNIKKAFGNGASEQEINIAVHLGKNSSYLTANNSIRVYHFNNTTPNLFTTLKVPSLPIHDNTRKELNETRGTLKTWMEVVNLTKQTYRKATAVLVYQHDPGGYITRDCLRSLVHDHKLTAPSIPLNTQYRREWDLMPKFKRNDFQVLYGGLSFGVCEGIDHSCAYLLMVKHPLDRILTVYNICQKNASSVFCHFNKLNVQNMTLQQFIKSQGSSFFRKLLYYSKHCRLVGDDEICLPDTKTSFVLTSKERRIYLENILENLENWFSVVGLEKHFDLSLQLFESVFGLNYTGCSRPTKLQELMRMDKHLWPLVSGAGQNTLRGFHNMSELTQVQNVTYHAIRAKLLEDPQVMKWLSADMAIYTKLEELFMKQLDVFNMTSSVIHTLKNPNYPSDIAPQLTNQRREIHQDTSVNDSSVEQNKSVGHKTKIIPRQKIHKHKKKKHASSTLNAQSNKTHNLSGSRKSTKHDVDQYSTRLPGDVANKGLGPTISKKFGRKNRFKGRATKHSSNDDLLSKIESSYEKLNRNGHIRRQHRNSTKSHIMRARDGGTGVAENIEKPVHYKHDKKHHKQQDKTVFFHKKSDD